MLETDRHVVVRHAVPCAFGPLDEYECIVGEDLIPSDVRELGRVAQSIQVKVKYRRSWGGVPMHERERRTRDILSHAISSADRLDERRLPGAKLARNRDEQWR